MISKSNMKRVNYVECKYVVLVSRSLTIGEIRDAISDAMKERKQLLSDVLMASVQICSSEEQNELVAVVIKTKKDIADVKDVTEKMEAEDKEFLSRIVDVIDGDKPKIYYTAKTTAW